MEKKISLLKGENFVVNEDESRIILSDETINKKYESCQHRIVTENGTLKLSQINNFFRGTEKFDLTPPYQRKYVWDDKRKSKLIESFIINLPIPPVFMIEIDYDNYQIMDGLQRITTLLDFYDNKFALIELEEWSELNGKFYKDLPQKIKEGIDRRQLMYVTVLKESTSEEYNTKKLEKMVFERLNTGGIKLNGQEVRNALMQGKFNDLCKELSKNDDFIELFKFNKNIKNDFEEEDEENNNGQGSLHMEDYELVLRFFAMRHYERWNGNLNKFFDEMLRNGNNYDDNLLKELKNIFNYTMKFINDYIGENAFCIYKNNVWSKPQKYIYDPLSLFVEMNIETLKKKDKKTLDFTDKIKKLYCEHIDAFNGKKQSKNEIERRLELFNEYLL